MPKPHAAGTRSALPVADLEDDSGNGESSLNDNDILYSPANENKDISVNYRGRRKAPASAAAQSDKPVPVLLELTVRAHVHAYILHEDGDELSGGADASLEHLCKLKEVPAPEGVVYPPNTYRYGAAEVTALLDARGAPFRFALLVEGTGALPKVLSAAERRTLAEQRRSAAEKELAAPAMAPSTRRWSAPAASLFERSGSNVSVGSATRTRSKRQLTLNELFDVLDTDKDGTLTKTEVCVVGVRRP